MGSRLRKVGQLIGNVIHSIVVPPILGAGIALFVVLFFCGIRYEPSDSAMGTWSALKAALIANVQLVIVVATVGGVLGLLVGVFMAAFATSKTALEFEPKTPEPSPPKPRRLRRLRLVLRGGLGVMFVIATVMGIVGLVNSGSHSSNDSSKPSSIEATHLAGHTGAVMAVAFSPDGTMLASGGKDKTVRLWDLTVYKELGTMGGYTDTVSALTFSPDGAILASGSYDGEIRLWDIGGQRNLATLTSPDSVTAIAFSPDGTLLASGGKATVHLWNVATKQELVLNGHTDWVASVAFSPDGKTLASGSYDHTIRLWDVAGHQEIAQLSGHTDAVLSVAFAPDGRLASASKDNTVRLWNTKKRQSTGVDKTHTAPVYAVAFSHGGATLVSGGADGKIVVLGPEEGHVLTGHNGTITSVALNPQGGMLASGGTDNAVILWPIDTHDPGPTNNIMGRLIWLASIFLLLGLGGLSIWIGEKATKIEAIPVGLGGLFVLASIVDIFVGRDVFDRILG